MEDRFVVEPESAVVRFVFEGYARAPTILKVDLGDAAAAPEPDGAMPTTVTADMLVAKRVVVTSGAGAGKRAVPITLLHRSDVTPDGSQPTLLVCEGALGGARRPRFDRTHALWADLGGVVALPQLPHGKDKQPAIEDLIAAADELIARGSVSRERLALVASRCDAALAAAALNQRPDLCRAVLFFSPVTDVLRYTRYPGTRAWAEQFGDPAAPTDFVYLRAHAPLSTLLPAQAYPAVLITGSLQEPAVPAMHARKLAAVWQKGSISVLPILLRIERAAKGAKITSGIRGQVAELVDAWTFLRMELAAAD